MEQRFERRGEELVEILSGDQLADNEGNTIEGRWEKQVYYPPSTARLMLKELERQVADAQAGIAAKKKNIKQFQKSRAPVDNALYKKFNACMARNQVDGTQNAIDNETAKLKGIQGQIDKLRAAWPTLLD